MKIILSSVKCDWCEASESFDNEQEELEAGWLVVQQGEDEKDFCSTACLCSHYN